VARLIETEKCFLERLSVKHLSLNGSFCSLAPQPPKTKTPLANQLGVLCVVEIEPPEIAKSIN